MRISCIRNPDSVRGSADLPHTEAYSAEVAHRVRGFHRSIPGYAPTPLLRLGNLEGRLGLDRIWLKDESPRFGLKAFKVLGASYAVSCLLAEQLGMDPAGTGFEDLRKGLAESGGGEITLATATDGNHGRAVAWAARMLCLKAVVYMPFGSSEARVKAIRGEGAMVLVVNGNYDAAVRLAEEKAFWNDWILVQDSSWEGYEEVPARIMQGYLTILDEVFEQIGDKIPTHLFLQCGVGSMAAALAAGLHQRLKERRPEVVVVEPENAACMFHSIEKSDGEPGKVGGELETVMAGLACGEPSFLAWRILRDLGDAFVSCSDEVTEEGMRLLRDFPEREGGIVSGESGAVTTGLLTCLLEEPEFRETAEKLGLTDDSRVLLLSTEGDTDPASYGRIIEGGKS